MIPGKPPGRLGKEKGRNMDKATGPIHTIGHSNMSGAELLRLLEQRHVRGVVDVRSAPYSRHVPHFNREGLQAALRQQGIAYTHMPELGGRPGNPALYTGEGRADYGMMALEPPFRRGLERVLEMAGERRVALLCTEADPLRCHRTLLVAHRLEPMGTEIIHLAGNGRSETHQEAMGRLMAMWKLLPPNGPGGETTRRELVERAISLQAGRVAHRR